MSRAPCQIQRATSLKFGMPTHVKASFHRAGWSIRQTVDCAISQDYTDALTVLHVDSRTSCGRELQALQSERGLIAPRLRETPIGRRAAQHIVHFLCQPFRSRDADMSSGDVGRQVWCNIGRNDYAGRPIGVGHLHLSCRNGLSIDDNRINVCNVEYTACNGQCRTIIVGHVACISGCHSHTHRPLIDIERLGFSSCSTASHCCKK